MRSASEWAFGPPAKSFIIRKCITCCVSKPSIAASPVIFIQFLNNTYLVVLVQEGQSQPALFVPRSDGGAPIKRAPTRCRRALSRTLGGTGRPSRCKRATLQFLKASHTKLKRESAAVCFPLGDRGPRRRDQAMALPRGHPPRVQPNVHGRASSSEQTRWASARSPGLMPHASSLILFCASRAMNPHTTPSEPLVYW